jgi:predicted N-acetyltransferase YhbS
VNPLLLTPQANDNLDSLYQMLDSVWEDGVAFYRDHYIGNSHYDYAVSRIAVLNNEVVSHWGVWNYDMRVGHAFVKTGGVGAVATKEQNRKHGLMTQLGEESLKAMRKAGYEVSVLQGFTSNYARFGYVRSWTDTIYEVHVDDINIDGQVPSFTEIQLSKNDAADELYNATHAHLTGTVVRPTYQNVLMRRRQVYGWSDDSRDLQGYIYVELIDSESTLLCMEVAGNTELALLVLRHLARANECTLIRFETLPHTHPVLIHLRRGTVRAVTDYNKSYGLKDNGWMIRLINLRSVLEKLSSDFTVRLMNSSFASWQGTLVLASHDEQVALEINSGNIRVTDANSLKAGAGHSCIAGGHHLVQLLIGTEDPLEVAHAVQMNLTNEASQLIRVLFPKQHPTLPSWDQF